MSYILLFSVFVIATCGLVYELIAGTLASYLLGDSITQFSTVIGAYLFSMGIGSYLSKYFNKNLLGLFVQVEFIIGIVGGFSAALLFLSFEYITHFRVLLYTIVGLTGTLVGFEIPILMRIMQTHFEFKDLVSKVFTYDYIGALIASIMFPLVLVPHLGLVRSALMFGIFNVLVGLWALFLFNDRIPWVKFLKTSGFACLFVLVLGFVYSERIMKFAEANSYPDSVIYSSSSKYQRIVLTTNDQDLRLFLNGNLQFSSRDEYRYHEALVHPGLSSLIAPKNVLVLGGGDGMAAREILKYSTVENIVLIDLDQKITDLFSSHQTLIELNGNSLKSPKVKVVNEDAFLWLRQNKTLFDFVVIDFPDPSNFSVGKLYSDSFYRLLKTSLAPHGLAVIQSTSPYVAKKSFWCVNSTLKSVGFKTTPYHTFVPAFGDWGYILAGQNQFQMPTKFPNGLRFIDSDVAQSMLAFPSDMKIISNEVNKLNNQILVRLFDEEWASYVH